MIELRDGQVSVGLVPEIGGSIAFLRIGGRDVMRPLSGADAAAGAVLGVASFPMIPFANRIDGNRFTFEGKTFEVAPNNGAEPFNVHGSGWQSAWTVAKVDGASAVLTLDHAAGPRDPFAYHATQAYSFDRGALVLTTTIINRSAERLPFGFGHHPWFPRDADTILRFRARDFWLEGPLGIVGDRISIPPELDFSAGRGLPGGWRNNDYGGWDGHALLTFPSRGVGLAIAADPVFGHLMFYADPKRDVFCLEPQTNLSCGFNRLGTDGGDLGIIALSPGEAAVGTIRFTPALV